MRGKLSKGIQEKSLKVLNREITEREMRLYAYVDFCLKNGGIIEFRKINADEEDILFALQNVYVLGNIMIISKIYWQIVMLKNGFDKWNESEGFI